MQLDGVAQVIVALATLVTAMGSLVASVLSHIRLNHVANNVQQIEKAANSMKDQLVESTAKASLAEGTAVGLEQGRAENIASNLNTPL
jgi:uncharacterized protein Yka (UPF0111/DUF47 family)